MFHARSDSTFRVLGSLWAVPVFMWIATASALAQRYSFEELAPLASDSQSQACGVNDAGRAVGFSQEFVTHTAALWTGSTPQKLWTFFAYQINAADQIVGQMEAAMRPHAALWDNGTVIDLHQFGFQSLALSINDSRVVVGWYWSVGPPFKGFRWENGVMQTFGSGFVPHEINNRDQVVGYLANQAALWDNGTATPLPSLPGFAYSRANAINDQAQIVGHSDDASGLYHALLWENGQLRDLGSFNPTGGFGASAANINELGQIVGTASSEPGFSRAFLWQRGILTDLNDLLVNPPSQRFLWLADDISDVGHIVGTTITDQGLARAFRLTPVEGSDLTVRSLTPARTGVVNTLEIGGATPGQVVYVLLGVRRAGGTVRAPGCGTLAIDVASPHVLGMAVAGADGIARLFAPVPAAVAGQPFVFQAIELSSCRVSPPGWTIFE